MKKYEDVKIDGGDQISLVKLSGHKIRDIRGYIIEDEYEEKIFILSEIISENGTIVDVQSENECAYLDDYKEGVLTHALLESVYNSDPNNLV